MKSRKSTILQPSQMILSGRFCTIVFLRLSIAVTYIIFFLLLPSSDAKYLLHTPQWFDPLRIFQISLY